MKSPLYQSPNIYNLALNVMHGSYLQKRYELISSYIDVNDRVLDVGCGTCMLSDFTKGEYYGIDLNNRFITHAQKKGLNVQKEDVMLFNKFHEFDTCVLVDILHHIAPNHPQFLERVVDESKNKVIVCEPYMPEGRYEIINRISRWLDYDGINKPPLEWMNKKQLYSFFNGFQPHRICELDDDIIVVYRKY